MKRSEEDIEAMARSMATFEPHDTEVEHFCQYPEQSPEFAMSNCSNYIGNGCRGCLIGGMAHLLTQAVPTIFGNGDPLGNFLGADALEVTRRAIAYAASDQTELLERHSAEVAA